ncbi:MAG TPA: hypothetical protein VG496_00660 [Myxococcales bacterium]|nr:hypothetical protein [Myxococcales bacterium]
MLALLSRLLIVAAGAFSARAYARDFVREYIRKLVRERLQTGVAITLVQLGLLAVTAVAVKELGNPLGGRLFGSALVWILIAYNVNRFFSSTLPDIAEARRHLSGPLGYVVRDLLGISIVKELVEMELFVLAVCLLLGLYVRFGVSSTFHLLAPWRELLSIRRPW